jgi:hypothetical protein
MIDKGRLGETYLIGANGAGLAASIDRYRQNESGWRPAKAPTESYYQGVAVTGRA